MKIQIITILALAAGFITTVALADNPVAATGSTPAAATAQAAVPDRIIYAPRLPSVAELTSAAAAQGLTIKQIDQTSREVSIITQTPAGQIRSVSYQLLADAGPNPATVTAPTVVYATPASPVYYYYDGYGPYYSAYLYPPVSVRLGFGFRGGRRW